MAAERRELRPSSEGVLKHASPFAFPKERRLRKRVEFLRVQETGSRISLPSAILLMVARADEGPARLGVTVTRKFGNAVARNRAKRLYREVFRRSDPPAPPGIDFVAIPKGGRAEPPSLARLMEEWGRALPLMATRAESLRRALANAPPPAQTGARRRLPR